MAYAIIIHKKLYGVKAVFLKYAVRFGDPAFLFLGVLYPALNGLSHKLLFFFQAPFPVHFNSAAAAVFPLLVGDVELVSFHALTVA